MIDILNHPLITQRYFFPQPGSLADPFIVDCGDAQLACSYHECDPQAKTLVHFHGNGEIVDDWAEDFAEAIVSLGCNCFLAEYRGYGRSTGRSELGRMLDDVPSTIKALGCPESELIFFGRSVGAIFALEAVSRFPAAAGLILESGIADVRERLLLRVAPEELGVTAEEFDNAVDARLNHQRKLAGFQGPVLVMHTRNDELVDVSHGQRLYDWAPGEKQLMIFPRGGHNNILYANAQDYFTALARFLDAVIH